jgi:hypothetical protein
MFLITELDTMSNTSRASLAAGCMTDVSYAADFIQPEASAYAHYCEIGLVRSALREKRLKPFGAGIIFLILAHPVYKL